MIVNILLRVSHSPTAATSLLVSLGAFTTANQTLSLIVVVLIIVILGNILRRIRISGNNQKYP